MKESTLKCKDHCGNKMKKQEIVVLNNKCKKETRKIMYDIDLLADILVDINLRNGMKKNGLLNEVQTPGAIPSCTQADVSKTPGYEKRNNVSIAEGLAENNCKKTELNTNPRYIQTETQLKIEKDSQIDHLNEKLINHRKVINLISINNNQQIKTNLNEKFVLENREFYLSTTNKSNKKEQFLSKKPGNIYKERSSNIKAGKTPQVIYLNNFPSFQPDETYLNTDLRYKQYNIYLNMTSRYQNTETQPTRSFRYTHSKTYLDTYDKFNNPDFKANSGCSKSQVNNGSENKNRSHREKSQQRKNWEAYLKYVKAHEIMEKRQVYKGRKKSD
ncbi:hypothetical protein CDIK_0609 [Cucumispora dikerogammari]|nr:hypothetical protein CDIK_0609 [Cucumispora dikerogammari]